MPSFGDMIDCHRKQFHSSLEILQLIYSQRRKYVKANSYKNKTNNDQPI